MHHELKCETEYYLDIIRFKKTFELRKNDRNFQPGDTFKLNEVKDGIPTGATTSPITIKYVFKGGEYGLDPDYCIFNW